MASTTPVVEEAPKSKKKLIIVGVLLIALLGGGYWFTQMRGSGEEPEPVPGEVLVMDSVSVNLAGGGYLKVGVALQFVESGGHGGGGHDGSKAQDLVIAQFSQASVSDVVNKREKMKAELEKKIVDAYHHEVLEIYFTDYVSQ
jgi:flagellar protein FliL